MRFQTFVQLTQFPETLTHSQLRALRAECVVRPSVLARELVDCVDRELDRRVEAVLASDDAA